MAVAAAARDPRFAPLREEEVGALSIAVSVLGPRRPLADPRALRVGQDGLAVRRGWHRGVLLPRVAVEHGWDAEAFLRHTCLKAGLPPAAWREPSCEVEAFLADEFGEGPEV